MKKLILVSGKARSGKDTFVNELTKDLDTCQVLDITGGLKKVVAEMFGISAQVLEENKDLPSVEFVGLGINAGREFTVRHFLQFIGNEIAPPLLGKFHWCMERQREMFSKDRDVNILCGIRQLKEIGYFTKMNPDKEVIVVKLERTINGHPFSPISEADKSHSNETEVDLIEADYTYTCENIEELKVAANGFKQTL